MTDIINSTAICIVPTFTTSSGFWVGEDPLEFTLPILMSQIFVIFAATRIVHLLLAPLGQPQVASHVLAGILLGPSFLGRNKNFARLFPPRSWIHLNLLSLLAYILFTFVIGVKTDLRIIRRSGIKAIGIGWFGYLFSFITGNVLSYLWVGRIIYGIQFLENFTYLSVWSVTYHPVLVCLLAEHNLLTSKLGRLALSTSLAIDFQIMILASLLTTMMTTFTGGEVVMVISAFLGVLGLILFVARPAVVWMIRRTPEGETLSDGKFVTVILIVLLCSLLGEIIGQNVASGGFLLGLVLPGGPPLGRTLVERLERLVSGLLLPVYYAGAGLRVDLINLVTGVRSCGYTVLMLSACSLAKFTGVAIAGVWYGLSVMDAATLGLMLSCHGIVDLSNFKLWLQTTDLFPQSYSLSILMLVAVSGITAGILKLVYNPTSQFEAYRRLSIEQTYGNEELRILACAHDEHNATPTITLIDSSLPNPTCVYLLHLVPLIGQTNTILASYKVHSNKRKSYHTSITDHIVNVFRIFEQNNPGRLSFLPFIAISPYASMHNDICQLALDKKIALIILPFHKSAAAAASAAKYINPAEIRVMNANVLLYAPCSVAIFIDRGFSHRELLSRSVAVFFIGGADDREAVAYASTMTDHGAVSLSLIRLVVPEELRGWDGEQDLDEAALDEFVKSNARNKRVDYREEMVRDGSDTMEVMRTSREAYDLLVVGRREGVGSVATAGLEMWSEFPELGVLGDVLASTDAGSNASTLVVQQQPSAVGGGGGGGGGDVKMVFCSRNQRHFGE